MKKLKRDEIGTILFLIILIVSTIYNYFIGTGNKISRIIMIFGVVIVLYLLFRIPILKKVKDIYLPTLIFVFFSTYCARVLNFYSLDCYDKILHFSSGILLGYVGIIVYDLLFENKNDKKGRMVFAIFFAIALAGLWEVWEFSCDKIAGMTLQKSIDDTMYDIICGSLGGILVSIFCYKFMKKY